MGSPFAAVRAGAAKGRYPTCSQEENSYRPILHLARVAP